VRPLAHAGTSSLPGVVDIQFNSSGLQTIISAPLNVGEQVKVDAPLAASTSQTPSRPLLQPTESVSASIALSTIAPPAQPAQPTQPTLIVSQQAGGDYTTITAAIANAEPGSRIYIRPGTYQEGIIITKPLELIGDGPTAEIIVESIGLQCLQMKTDYARVRGLTLRERAGPIAVDIAQGRLIMEDCDISSDTPLCVVVQNSETRPMFYRCKIHDVPGIGILFYKWSQGTVDSCEVCHNDLAGIKIAQNSNPHIRQTSVHHNGYAGIHISDSGRGLIDTCEITENELDAIEITNEANPCIRNCTLRDQVNGGGISIYANGRGIIEGCKIMSDTNAGIHISQFGNPYFRRCMVRTTKQHLLVVKDQGRGTFERCQFSSTVEQPFMLECEENLIIRQCTICNNNAPQQPGTLWDNRPVPRSATQLPFLPPLVKEPKESKEQKEQAVAAVAWSGGKAIVYP
jgi:hypothetical protein